MAIQVLKPSDARRIAAGEVIDRPSGALRELLDNAIDAKPNNITIYLEQGGIKSLNVIDDGLGIGKDDLPLAILPHATSKISSIEDLQHSYTLGFRGEALSSLAACSRLTIKSRTATSDGYSLTASDSIMKELVPVATTVGTSVMVSELFYNLTSRKRFLKGPNAEGRECLNVFFEKALAFPSISFTYYADHLLKYQLSASDLLTRVKNIYNEKIGEALFLEGEYTLEKSGFTLQIVAGPPSVYRNDRRYIHLYINGRRIIEYALVQAVLHAYNKVLPAGQYPVCFVFLTVRANLADFNIHPAKREVMLHHLPIIHKAIVHTLDSLTQTTIPKIEEPLATPSTTIPLQEQLSLTNLSGEVLASSEPALALPENGRFFNDKPFNTLIQIEQYNLLHKASEKSSLAYQIEQKRLLHERYTNHPWRYLGQLMGVFLLVEWDQTLYLIDQHAAHERILFDQYSKSPMTGQRLLTPLTLEVTNEERLMILLNRDELASNGIEIEAKDDTNLTIVACPSMMDFAFWQEFTRNLGPNLSKELFATMACRAAVKEGEYLDEEAARHLIDQTFALNHPFCPHGRPVWVEIGRDQLYKWVKRIV